MLIKDLQTDFFHKDERGSLTQLLHENCGQVNVLISYAGTSRGNHYHKIATESFFVVSGSVEVTCTLNKESEVRTFREGDFFQISPSIVHSMSFREDCTMVAMYDICVEKEDGTKDIFAEENEK